MKRVIIFAALICATPASAQSALEWAASQGTHAAPSRHVSAVRSRSPSLRLSAPLEIRTSTQIVATAAQFIGSRNPTGFRGAWCKAFANMVARRSGYYANASLRAVDTSGMGQRVAGPVPGAFRVTRHHVAIVAAVHGRTVVAISGNNRHGRVGWSHYAARGASYYLPIRG